MATSYANNSGTGDRRPEIVVTTDIVSAATDIGGGVTYGYEHLLAFVDAITSGSLGTTGREFGVGNNNGDHHITFDWGVGASVVIDEIKLYLSGTHNFGSWTIDGSNNGSSWTTLKSAFTLQASGGSQTCTFTNSTGYRYYRFHTTSLQTNGGGDGTWSEFEFKISDATQSTRCSYYNTGGKGNRSSLITATATLTFSSGTVATLVDGDFTNNSSHSCVPNTGQSGANMVFDFGVTGYIIDTYFLWFLTNPGGGNTQGTWKLQGSNNNSAYTDLESASALNNQGNFALAKHTVVNTTGYRYYRLLQTTGSTTTPTLPELEFRIQAPASNTNKFPFQVILMG